ncbi:GGDEF domain-containing protein [Thaumasiovibrio sp. DFM-14]|uniref:GGDEF domain-containing protein n=1 Tax=Thaumasiovibrio sp. DFM-14 TaxID=3384792 RepID=UPI0039A0A598
MEIRIPTTSDAIFKKLLMTLLLFTVTIIVWHRSGGAQRDLVIKPPEWRFTKIDDSLQGGNSEVSIVQKEEGASISCTLRVGATYPFCEIAIVPEKEGKGIDLSNYYSMSLDVDYYSVEPNERIRVYLRNSHPAYTKEDDPVSQKFNAIEYAPGINQGINVIPLNAFHVLSWWIADYNIDLEHAGPDLSNITHIEIATGSYVNLGEYTLSLNGITFHGYWITETELFKVLVILWISCAVVFLCYEYLHIRSNFTLTAQREARLRMTNLNLSMQAKKYAALAERDTLTGIKNRAAVQEWLDQVVEQSNSHHRPFSVIFIDLDHFKAINSRYGHFCGDDVLRQFCRLTLGLLDIHDVFVRWGGEEFIIFCPNRDIESATELAENIRYQVLHHEWPENISMTLSAGVAQLEGETAKELIQRADDALYKAKEAGRNRVAIMSPYQRVSS